MSGKAAKGTKKPKVLPVHLSADGGHFSQTISSSRGSSRPALSGSESEEEDDDSSRGRSTSTRRAKTNTVQRVAGSSTAATSPLVPHSTRSDSRQAIASRPGAIKPLRVEDCLKKMLAFVKAHDLKHIIGQGFGLTIEQWEDEELVDEKLRVQLQPQAEIAAQLPINLGYVTRELAMSLAILSLYDLAVLIDDSISMEFEESGSRKEAVKSVLSFIAEIYGAVSNEERGIRAIRFLNGHDDVDANNIKTTKQIDEVIDNHEFEGLTRIGTGLMKKILWPFVFDETVEWDKKSGDPRKLKELERPLLIMVITDGAVDGEHESRLGQAIQGVVDSLTGEGYDPDKTKAVAFQFARVGDDDDARQFLEELDNTSAVRDYVDTLSGEDLMEIMGLRTKSKKLTVKHQQRMIKLLLGPLMPNYDKMDSKEEDLNSSRIDRDYDSDKDFSE